jgi:hypothetical protein
MINSSHPSGEFGRSSQVDGGFRRTPEASEREIVMATPNEPVAFAGLARARDRVGLVVSWGLWAAMTAGLFAYIHRYSRNIPYSDEFEIVPVMTGAQPVTLGWAWAQHNEHRPFIPRLVIAGLFRSVATDFRVARYANALLLSATAGAMLLVARKVRGSARLVDAVLPLVMLNIAQGESLLNAYAMSLILNSVLTIALLAAVGFARRSTGTPIALAFGLSCVLLPLCSGSGLAMLPPLMAWLAGYVAWGWWSEERPAAWGRALGLGLLAGGLAIALLYLRGYSRPAQHPLPPSARAFAASALKYLSLTVYPSMNGHARPAALLLVGLVTTTLALLAMVSVRSRGERPRALALAAIIVAMLGVAAVVGFSRAGLGPDAGLASRYVTLAMPLFCAVYLAWIAYGRTASRTAVPAVLLAVIILASRGAYRYGHWFGSYICASVERVERGLRDREPMTVLLDRACPAIFPDREAARGYFNALKEAEVGPFAGLRDDQVAIKPGPASMLLR